MKLYHARLTAHPSGAPASPYRHASRLRWSIPTHAAVCHAQWPVNRNGGQLTFPQFRFGFDAAREKVGADWQLRDLRAKAATDLQNLAQAQKLLGHRSRNTTEIYTRDRKGELVNPLRS